MNNTWAISSSGSLLTSVDIGASAIERKDISDSIVSEDHKGSAWSIAAPSNRARRRSNLSRGLGPHPVKTKLWPEGCQVQRDHDQRKKVQPHRHSDCQMHRDYRQKAKRARLPRPDK